MLCHPFIHLQLKTSQGTGSEVKFRSQPQAQPHHEPLPWEPRSPFLADMCCLAAQLTSTISKQLQSSTLPLEKYASPAFGISPTAMADVMGHLGMGAPNSL